MCARPTTKRTLPPDAPDARPVFRAIARRMTLSAIDAYHAARQVRDEVEAEVEATVKALGYEDRDTRRQEDFDEVCRLDDWRDLAIKRFEDARSTLIRSLVAWNVGGVFSGSGTVAVAEKWVWEPRGFVHDGRLYVAAPASDCEIPVGEGGRPGAMDLMTLIVVDLDDVVGWPVSGDGGA